MAEDTVLTKTTDGDGDDFSGSSKFPQAGSRPVTTRPVTSGRARGPVRPVTSMSGRPGTSMVPDWMYQEEGRERPKTGFRPDQVRHTVPVDTPAKPVAMSVLNIQAKTKQYFL